MLRFPLQPMWDLTIHPPSGPTVLPGTRSLLQPMWDPSIHPPSGPSVFAGTPSRVHPSWGSVSLLAHSLVFATNTICNSLSSPLADIVLNGLSFLGFPSRFLNVFARERFPHPYKKCFVLLSNRYGISHRGLVEAPMKDI